MIFDSIKNIGKYNLGDEIIEALNYATKYTKDNYSTDRVNLKNGNYILPNEYQTQIKNPIIMEAHRKYIDVMYMVEGSENILIKSTDTLDNITSPYDEDGDYLLSEVNAEMSSILLNEGDFIILYPQDAHCPSCAVGDVPSNVKKVICKVQL